MSQTKNHDTDPARVGGVFNTLDGKQFGELYFSREIGFSFRPSTREDLGESSRNLQAQLIKDWEDARKGYLDGEGTFCDAGVCICPQVEEIQEISRNGETHRIARLERESWEAIANAVTDITGGVADLLPPFSLDREGILPESTEGELPQNWYEAL